MNPHDRKFCAQFLYGYSVQLPFLNAGCDIKGRTYQIEILTWSRRDLNPGLVPVLGKEEKGLCFTGEVNLKAKL